MKSIPVNIYYFDANALEKTLILLRNLIMLNLDQKLLKYFSENPNESPFIGYMELYKKHDNIVLKARGPLKGVISSGFYVDQKGKKDVITMIEVLLGNNKLGDEISKLGKNPHLIMIIEIILRYLDLINHKNRRHFLTTHEYLMTKNKKN